jgi:hypothetical protein
MQTLVNHLNWRSNEEFLHFLRFDFSLTDAPAEVRHQVLTLIPLAVAEERLVGAIKETVLKAAITAWNKPEQIHMFLNEGDRWRYLSSFALTHAPSTTAKTVHSIHFIIGKLKRSLNEGSYCRAPQEEVIRTA